MAMMVEQEQDTVLPFQCPDGCTVVYYIKQLSPSDAACSKQIKLPKTEARSFVGDLRHKQRSLVVSSSCNFILQIIKFDILRPIAKLLIIKNNSRT